MKTRLLPMVAPRLGVSGVDWFLNWQRACIETGKPKGDGIPMLPFPTQSGWARIPIGPGEGADWLRQLLHAAGVHDDALKNIGTHSLKATCLSWLAKHGDPIDVRRHLGYHMSNSEKMTLLYSRDAAAMPLRVLDQCLLDIRNGTFMPDNTRSGYFPNVAMGADAPQSVEVPDEEEELSSDSEDSQDDEDSFLEHPSAEAAVDHVVGAWNELASLDEIGVSDDAPLFRNKFTRFIHVVADESGARFRCGREVNQKYVLLESKPKFMATSLGVSEAVLTSLCTNGVNTLAKFAFCSAYVPGNSDESAFVNAIQNAIGHPPTVGELATLRRLFHEAYGLTAAELRSSVERVEDQPIKKLAQPERADRLAKQQAKLKGLRIEGKMEPSDRLCDLANAIYEENRLQHIEISRCTSKEQEVLCSTQKDDKHVSVDTSGNVRIKDKESKIDADLSTDMLTRLAFVRRGLALDQANVLDYLEHDRWVERLFDCKVSSQPDGYAKISMQQIINADRKLFVKLAELTRTGIQLTGTGRPLDLVFKKAMDHPDVLHLLQPLPVTAAAGVKRTRDGGDEPGDHEHLPIGRTKQADGSYKWDTADEAAYTPELCRKEPSGVFGMEPRPQQISVEELWNSAKFIRPALLGKVRQSTLDDDRRELWKLTMDETTSNGWMLGPFTTEEMHHRMAGEPWKLTMDETTSNGWMLGPFTTEEMHHRMAGEPWIPVRRFGVWQSSGDKVKLRPIDDYAESRVNTAFGYSDKLDLRTLDQVIWASAAIVRCIREGHVDFRLSDGNHLTGPVHPLNLQGDNGTPMVSVLDLSSAYKQFALSPICRRMSVISIRDPVSGQCMCFEGRVLPFGATASVVHFNRIARLVQAVGFRCGILWGNYFDDYPMVTTKILARSSMTASTTLLDLLGFEYATHKLKPFADRSSVLGVDIDLDKVDEGLILVRNKPSRVEEVTKIIDRILQIGTASPKEASSLAGRLQFADSQVMGRLGRLAMFDFRQCLKQDGTELSRVEEVTKIIDRILQNGTVSPKEASSLAGRLQFADSQVMGRLGRLAMFDFRQCLKQDGTELRLDGPAIKSLEVMRSRLLSGRPRELSCSPGGPPVVVNTDGASEGDLHTIGGVMTFNGAHSFFSCKVPDELVSEWRQTYQHIIGLVELYAVVVAASVWSADLSGKRVLFFVDNQPALDALIKGTSASPEFRRLLESWEVQADATGALVWFSRVPSNSNPADGPSRGSLELMLSIGASRVESLKSMDAPSPPRLLFAQVILMAIMTRALTVESCLLVTRISQVILQTVGSPPCMSGLLELFRGTYAAYKLCSRPGFRMPNSTTELPQTAHPAAGVTSQSFGALINDTYRQYIQENLNDVLTAVGVIEQQATDLWPVRYRSPVQKLVCTAIKDARIQLENLQLVLRGSEQPNCPQLDPPFSESSPRTPTLWGE
eukprot:s3385_g11.t1